MAAHGNVGLPEVFTVGKPARLLTRRQGRRCWHRKARFAGDLRDGIGLRGEDGGIRARLLIAIRVRC